MLCCVCVCVCVCVCACVCVCVCSYVVGNVCMPALLCVYAPANPRRTPLPTHTQTPTRITPQSRAESTARLPNAMMPPSACMRVAGLGPAVLNVRARGGRGTGGQETARRRGWERGRAGEKERGGLVLVCVPGCACASVSACERATERACFRACMLASGPMALQTF